MPRREGEVILSREFSRALQRAIRFPAESPLAGAPRRASAKEARIVGPIPAGVQVFCDGSHRVRNGRSRVGVSIQDATGAEVYAISTDVVYSGSNRSEVAAISVGVEAALALGCTSVMIWTDLQAAEEAIWDGRDMGDLLLLPMIRRIRRLVRGFTGGWDIGWLPGERNRRAHHLAYCLRWDGSLATATKIQEDR